MNELVWINEHDALALHGLLLALYGGAPVTCDLGLLESALARPRDLHTYADDPEVIKLTAAYTAGIIRNHPFVDGDERTGFVVGVLFLETNGYRMTASEEDATQAVMALAAGTV